MVASHDQFGVVAPRLVRNGYRPLPILRGSKRPPMKGWPEFVVDDAALQEYRRCGTGLLCGELIGVDIDVLDPAAADELHTLARAELGDGLARIGRAPKILIAYRAAARFRKHQTRTFLIDGHATKVEVLAGGQQFVAFAIHPETREPYRWLGADPLTVPFAALPEVTEQQITSFISKAEAILAKYGVPEKPDRMNGGEPPREAHRAAGDDPARRAYAEAALADETRRVATASAGGRNDRLNTAALKLGGLVAGGWLDRTRVERSLEDAAAACGLVRDDGLESVRATIRSGLEAGMRDPRDPPDREQRGTRAWAGPREAPADEPPPEPKYPAPPAAEAFHGLAGELIRAIEPHTEADPAGILVQFLVCAGNAVGRGPHCFVEASRHHLNLFTVLVGQTSKARKGTSLGWAKRATVEADPDWERCTLSGLASGEGLIHAVRDARFTTNKKGEQTVEDEGVTDKRLLVIEEEFARVTRVAGRSGNTLLSVMRDAWDGKRILAAASKNSPSRATGAHISVIGHITTGELLDAISETDATSGVGNRFLWVFVRRSKLLPFGGDAPELGDITTRLARIIDHARGDHSLAFDRDAAGIWREVYPELSKERAGLLGAMLARGEAHVKRLAMLYAVLDGARSIGAPHLLAALALWEFSEASARYVFGPDLDNSTADRILGALRCAEEPLSQTDLHGIFCRNLSGTRLLNALNDLQRRGLVRRKCEPSGGGRPKTLWEAVWT